MDNGLRFLMTPEILGEPMPTETLSAKSLSLTNFKLKAGYREDQARSSETGQWTDSGGSATKKPKKDKKTSWVKQNNPVRTYDNRYEVWLPDEYFGYDWKIKDGTPMFVSSVDAHRYMEQQQIDPLGEFEEFPDPTKVYVDEEYLEEASARGDENPITKTHDRNNKPEIRHRPPTLTDAVETAVAKAKQKLRAKQQRTPEFKKWFNGSRAVDDRGVPLVLYHGSDQTFAEFDASKIGQRTEVDGHKYALGFHFTTSRDEAGGIYYNEKETGNRVYEVYTSIKNPFVIDTEDDPSTYVDNPQNKTKIMREFVAAKKRGKPYDSIMVRGRNPYHEWQPDSSEKITHVIALDPTQIKSAIHNQGTWNPDDPRITKSISLTQLKLKAGYREDQQRSSETGQWTSEGGSTKKPKKPKKETRRTLEEEIHARGGEMDEDFNYTGEDAVDDDVARNLREWENPDSDRGDEFYKGSTSNQKYNDNIYDRQRDYMLGLIKWQHLHVGYYTGDSYIGFSNATTDPLFWEWQGGDESAYDKIPEGQQFNYTGAQVLRNMIEKSPDISEDTVLYSGTGAEHFLGDFSALEVKTEYGKMLEEEYQKIGVDFEEAVDRISTKKQFGEQGYVEAKRASNLMGHRVAAEISKNMKYKGELSPKRFLSTSVDFRQASYFSELGNVEHDAMYSTETRYGSGEGLVPIVVARYKGLKKGLGIAPLTATSRHVSELEVLIGGGTNKMKFVGASYEEEKFTLRGKTNHGVVYVDFEGVE